MMAEFRRIKMSLFLILVLQFTATGQNPLVFFVRVGDDVTLPCQHVTDNQDKCSKTTWIFSKSSSSKTVTVFEFGKIHEAVRSKSDRLNVTEKCSLVIKKVTDEDVGRYYCQKYKSGQRQGSDTEVYLSVVTMTEHKDGDEVTLTCSVLTYGDCSYTAEWLYEGKKDDVTDMKRSQSSCSDTVTFTTSDLNHKLNNNKLLKCKVTDIYTKTIQEFTFTPQTSKEKTGLWWLYIIVAVGLAALFIVVVLIRWKKTKGNETQTDESTADPEHDVSYASISYFKRNSKAQVHTDADNKAEGDAVTYSTIKVPSSG